MKYQVGDKVRVRSDLEVGDYGKPLLLFNKDMLVYKGKEFIIASFCEFGYNIKDNGFILNEFIWNDEMLEPVEYKIPVRVISKEDLIKKRIRKVIDSYNLRVAKELGFYLGCPLVETLQIINGMKENKGE